MINLKQLQKDKSENYYIRCLANNCKRYVHITNMLQHLSVEHNNFKYQWFLDRCKNCNHLFFKWRAYNNLVSCSHKCRLQFLHKVLKQQNKSFWNSEIQIKLSKKGTKIGVPRAVISNRLNSTGFYSAEIQQQCRASRIKNNSGWANSDIQRELAHKAIIAIRKRRRKLIFNNCKFDSYGELEFAMNLYNQLEIKLIEKKTVHVRVGKCEYDFFINGVFIEYHPYCITSDHDSYYNYRRKNLNENGCAKYPLIVIK